MVRMSRIALCLSTLTVAGALIGCSIPGTPVAGEPDVRKLEVGRYPVDRHEYEQDAAGNGALLEGMRMADAVAPSIEVDPSLTSGRGSTVLASTEDALNFLAAEVSRPILNNRNFVVGYAALGADKPDPDGENRPAPDATAVTTVLLRFPDESTAKQAARELEDADIGVSPENRKLTSKKYPDAYLHWRPGIANAGAFLAHKEFVISLFVQRPTADENDLVTWIDKTFAAEVPLLDTFRPTPMDRLDSLRVDPDDMLSRVVVEDREGHTPDPVRFAVYGPADGINSATDQAEHRKLVQDTGLDRTAYVDTSALHRLRDADAARRFQDALLDDAGDQYDPIGAPNDVPNAKCVKLNANGDPERDYEFHCFVTYKRYVAIVRSDLEPDVRQKIAAQYALLANSL